MKEVLIRGLGPSLADMNVTGALQDPMLELRDSQMALLQMNDNWEEQDDPTDKDKIIATGIPPSDPREAALITTLNPGGYTAILSGVNATTGVGLVEVYDLH